MTSFITTPCPGCGPTDIAIEHVTLLVGDGTPVTASICCPACGCGFVTPVEEGMDLLLATVGVTVELVALVGG